KESGGDARSGFFGTVAAGFGGKRHAARRRLQSSQGKRHGRVGIRFQFSRTYHKRFTYRKIPRRRSPRTCFRFAASSALRGRDFRSRVQRKDQRKNRF